MYGPRLVHDYGQFAPTTWGNVIGALTEYELQRGLKNLLNGFPGGPKPGFVPDLPQFIAACRFLNEEVGRVPESHRLGHTHQRDPWFGRAMIFLMRWAMKHPQQFSKEQMRALGRECERIAKAYTDLEKGGELVTDAEMHENLQESFERLMDADRERATNL